MFTTRLRWPDTNYCQAVRKGNGISEIFHESSQETQTKRVFSRGREGDRLRD